MALVAKFSRCWRPVHVALDIRIEVAVLTVLVNMSGHAEEGAHHVLVLPCLLCGEHSASLLVYSWAMQARHKIVLNRATCNRCRNEVVSRDRHDYVTCPCGYLSVDGGRDYLKRRCDDSQELYPPTPAPEPNYRDFSDTSIITQTYSRRGLLVEAYRTDIVIHCTGPAGDLTVADAEDFVVYEAEGGSSAWKPATFFTRHQLQDDSQP